MLHLYDYKLSLIFLVLSLLGFLKIFQNQFLLFYWLIVVLISHYNDEPLLIPIDENDYPGPYADCRFGGCADE